MGLLKTILRKAKGQSTRQGQPDSLNLPRISPTVTRAPRAALSPIPAQSPIVSNSIAATVKPFGGRK